MILYRDNVSIQGGLYRLCESAFVDIDMRLLPGRKGLLSASFAITDALGTVRASTKKSKPFALSALVLAVVESLPIDLAQFPRVPASDPCLRNWADRSLGDRALIYLHAIYDRVQSRGRKISYLEFVLRTLVNTSSLRLVFQMEEDRVTKVVAFFGDQDKAGFAVEGLADPKSDFKTGSFIPLPDTCET